MGSGTQPGTGVCAGGLSARARGSPPPPTCGSPGPASSLPPASEGHCRSQVLTPAPPAGSLMAWPFVGQPEGSARVPLTLWLLIFTLPSPTSLPSPPPPPPFSQIPGPCCLARNVSGTEGQRVTGSQNRGAAGPGHTRGPDQGAQAEALRRLPVPCTQPRVIETERRKPGLKPTALPHTCLPETPARAGGDSLCFLHAQAPARRPGQAFPSLSVPTVRRKQLSVERAPRAVPAGRQLGSVSGSVFQAPTRCRRRTARMLHQGHLLPIFVVKDLLNCRFLGLGPLNPAI
ncbi:PREDICTED: neural Wiskott-Aldrich syndrome protein-like [Chinchilla lanigera]|uniref:neural Wiskott-Aldrich syndrome protein-like n=1 Tax=Chinchilla lanigera TaxID=34839 RepID=UPI000697B51E|nr:PREDICTED: neural Wiskott-Aldrich syndrome protein-like [Chinchilla lanigera]